MENTNEPKLNEYMNEYGRELIASLFEAGYRKIEPSVISSEEIQVKTTGGVFTATEFSFKGKQGVTLRANKTTLALVFEDEFYNLSNFKAGVFYAANRVIR